MNDTIDTPPDPIDAEGLSSPEAKPVMAGSGATSDVSAEAAPEVSLRASQAVEKRMGQPQQGEMPFAVVLGEAITELPKDLYIPPRALEVFLEAFEGPLDLLLYLIRRQNLDILDIDVAVITEQYMQYVELMDAVQFELAAEYLLMAAMLAEIKSRMLLPRSTDADEEEEDPRATLVRRLQEYERFKKAAEDMAELPRVERDTWVGSAEPPVMERTKPLPDVNLQDLVIAFSEVLKRADLYESHQIKRESLSTRERMADVLQTLQAEEFCAFESLFKVEEGRLGVVVTFLAILELIKESLVDIVQSDEFSPIHIKARSE